MKLKTKEKIEDIILWITIPLWLPIFFVICVIVGLDDEEDYLKEKKDV